MDFNQVWELVEPATEIGDMVGRDQLEVGLIRGDYQAFLGENSVAIGAKMGETYRIGLYGGDLDEAPEIEKRICKFAQRLGCQRVQIVGRRGWLKALDAYRDKATILEKEL